MRMLLPILAVVLVLAQEPPAAPPRPTPGYVPYVLTAINRERAKAGLRPVVRNERLRLSAVHHARNMGLFDKMAHELPQADLPTFAARLNFFGYRPTYGAGEIIAWNYPDAEGVVQAWLASPGHRRVMLHPDLREVGAGIGFNARLEIFVCVEFGRGP